MTLRSVEHFFSPVFRRFMNDVNTIDRFDLLVIKGGAFLQDMLVGIAAHRTGQPESRLQKTPFAKLARLALDRRDEASLLEHILAFAKIRNRPAHKIEVDEFVEEFKSLWERMRGDANWPDDSIAQRDYCQSYFVHLGFELHRCGYDLPPTDVMTGKSKLDWERLRAVHVANRAERV